MQTHLKGCSGVLLWIHFTELCLFQKPDGNLLIAGTNMQNKKSKLLNSKIEAPLKEMKTARTSLPECLYENLAKKSIETTSL